MWSCRCRSLMRFSTRACIVSPGGMADAAADFWCLVLFGAVAAALGAEVAGAAVLGAGVAAGAGALAAGLLGVAAGGGLVVCAKAGTAASSEVANKVVANFMAGFSVA